MVEERDVPLALAAGGWIATIKACAGTVGVIDEYRAESRAPVIALAGDQLWRAVQRDVGERGLHPYVDGVASRAGGEYETYALEIDEQRVGSDVVGFEGLRIECRRIMGREREVRAVEDQIAADRREPGRAQRGDQRLKLLDCDFRVAVAFEDKVAVEGFAVARSIRIGFGLPPVVGPEQLERCEGSHQLHCRSRIHRLRRVVRQKRMRGTDFAHVEPRPR